MMLTAERLREVMHYDPETGIFTRLKGGHGVKAGSIAGSVSHEGYLDIRIDGALYRAHRLAWVYVHGAWPTGVIDHKDRVKSHNWINNLRDVTHTMNLRNQVSSRADSELGVLGVMRSGKKFRTEITVDGKKYHVGSFATIEEAGRAYAEAKAALHPGAVF